MESSSEQPYNLTLLLSLVPDGSARKSPEAAKAIGSEK